MKLDQLKQAISPQANKIAEAAIAKLRGYQPSGFNNNTIALAVQAGMDAARAAVTPQAVQRSAETALQRIKGFANEWDKFQRSDQIYGLHGAEDERYQELNNSDLKSLVAQLEARQPTPTVLQSDDAVAREAVAVWESEQPDCHGIEKAIQAVAIVIARHRESHVAALVDKAQAYLDVTDPYKGKRSSEDELTARAQLVAALAAPQPQECSK